MSKYTPAILISVFMLLIVGGVVGYALHATAPKKVPRFSQVISSTVGQQPSATTQGGSTLGVASDGNVGSSLQSNLGGQSNSSSSNSRANTPPEPESFGQYEQYKDNPTSLFADIKVGTGTEVVNGSTVAVSYKGWLTNGQLFDQTTTDKNGKLNAFQFQVGAHAVISGWEQDIVGMKVGGSRRFIVPPAAGYGAEGHEPVPGNAVLVFDVNLLDAQ